MLHQIIMIIPEILLVGLAITMQIVDLYCKSNTRFILISTIILSCCIVLYLLCSSCDLKVGFLGSFVISHEIFLYKAIVLFFSIISIVIYNSLMIITKFRIKMEFTTLVLLSTVGIFISISSRDLILLFCGLELQSLCGYALASFNPQSPKSSEAGLKYFLFGTIVSVFMLLGISFLYGFSGGTKFNNITEIFNSNVNIGLIVGTILLFIGILFKLSAAPLHAWTLDVYEGAPVYSVIYFATVQKIGMLVVLVNIIDYIIGHQYTLIYNNIIRTVAILSMIIGSCGAITQSSLKRLMGYSSILNTGYVLVAISIHSPMSNKAAFIHMVIYSISTIGFFTCIISLFGKSSDIVTFNDLQGISNHKSLLACALAIFMFSMIGLPPFAGFFGKYLIFYNAVLQGKIIISFLGLLTTIIAAFYYLKVIKYMYFTTSTTEPISFVPMNFALYFLILLSIVFVCIFSLIYQ